MGTLPVAYGGFGGLFPFPLARLMPNSIVPRETVRVRVGAFMLPVKPKMRVMMDMEPPTAHWCGLFEGGYSSIGPVSRMSLAEAMDFYRRILIADGALLQ